MGNGKHTTHLPQSLLKHLLPLRLLREGRVQAAQQAELRFCHTVVFHAVLTVFFKIHVAVQLIDGFIIQPQRFLQSLLTVTVGTLHNALVVIQILQELTGAVQCFRFLCLQHGGVGQERAVLLPDVLQGFGKIVVILHGRAIRITNQLTDVWYLEANITEHGIRENIDIKVIFHRIEVFLVSGEDEGVVRLSIDAQRHAEYFIPALIPPRLCHLEAVEHKIREHVCRNACTRYNLIGEIIGKVLEELKQAGYKFDTAYQTAENGDQVVILRDMVVNGKSLNFTKTTDAEGNTKLIWGNYEKQAEGAPSAYDMVYGTEYEYEGKTYTIVWGYESQNNPNTTAAAGVLDAFGPDSNVKVTGENIDGTDSARYTVTIYGALREVTDPVIPTNPEPETPEGSDPTPPAPTTPTTPAVQDARPTTPAVEQAVAKTAPAPETPVNPPVQDARPESGKLIQTGTTNWMADVLVRAGGVLLAAGYLLERKRKSMFHKAQH